MKNKKIFVCAAVATALFINFPSVLADEVETFGEDFDNENNSEVVPFQDENLGPVLVFNDPEKINMENPEIENPPVVENPSENNYGNDSTVLVVDKPTNKEESILKPIRTNNPARTNNKSKKLKTQKPRFIKLAIDDTYAYYLDKQSVIWQRVPYSAGEYMLDVWVRMIEKNPDTSELPEDLAEYINNKHSGEIELAREKGLEFAPGDVEVLQNKKYFLEHYYLRPKTKQIQFLCELEVVGHPQNTISERTYDYKNWENLIPGSIESIIYNATMKEVGKSGSSEHGHMSFADMLEEYARISIR